MPQIFGRSANSAVKISKISIVAPILTNGAIGLLIIFGCSSYVTRTDKFVEQPVQFSHAHQVRDDGIDCRYCHMSVEISSFAGIPPTQT